jgi:hypothetical protein
MRRGSSGIFNLISIIFILLTIAVIVYVILQLVG